MYATNDLAHLAQLQINERTVTARRRRLRRAALVRTRRHGAALAR